MPSVIGYIVKSQDSLWNIAKRFYTTVDRIKELNDLEDNNINIGEKLIIMKKVDRLI